MELKTIRQQAVSQLEDKEERDVVSPWDVPLEILELDSRAKVEVRSIGFVWQIFHLGCFIEMTNSTM